MKAFIAVIVGALAAGTIGFAAPAAAKPGCRAIPFAGCGGSDSSPFDPKNPKGGKQEAHKAGNPSDPNTGHPPIRWKKK